MKEEAIRPEALLEENYRLQAEDAREIFAPRASRVVELCRKHNAADILLDVEAGFGTFCEEVNKLAFFRAELVRKQMLKGGMNQENSPFLKYVLIDEWPALGDVFQKFLSENNLSSHLWIVAKKLERHTHGSCNC